MSMPSYPPNGADLTREQALTMIVASIAMEERALSHIIDAEGEKIRYILGRLEGSCGPRAYTREVLEVNKSVTKLLDIVMQNQMLLKNKLSTALDAGRCCWDCCPPDCCPPERPPKPSCRPPEPPPQPPCCPPERPCPPEPPSCGEPKAAAQFTARCTPFLWKSGCPLEWACRCRRGGGIRWEEHAPGVVRLDPRRAYQVSYTVNICDVFPLEASGRICLEGAREGLHAPPPLWFAIRCHHGEPTTLQYETLLLPCAREAGPLEISVCLHARSTLRVEQAELNIAEL